MNSSPRKGVGLTSGVLATTLWSAFFSAIPITAQPMIAKSGVKSATYNANQLLQSTLSRYGAMNSVSAHIITQNDLTEQGKTRSFSTQNTLFFAKPYKFRATLRFSFHQSQQISTTVSDGKSLVHYSNDVYALSANASQMPAPRSARAVEIMENLTVVRFLGSAAERAQFIPPTTPIKAQPDTLVGTIPCRVVSLFLFRSLGNTQIAIGKADGLIHRVSYDMDSVLASETGGDNMPEKRRVTETYSVIQVNPKITNTTFSTALPRGITLAAAPKEPGPPVPIGQMAPNFSFTPLGEITPVKLSDYKGQVVLLDFWATWCSPCRASLPETQRLNATYGDKGLKVLAISNEKLDKISPFIEQNKYTFPVYRDTQNNAGKAFGIVAIPTFAIIDKEGRLAAFFVGLQEEGVVEAALKKAGLGTP